MKKNILVGQSGGPTAVINASLYGVVAESRAYPERIETVYGMVNGIEGFLSGRTVNLSKSLTSQELLLLKQTPAAYLGSCRYQLPENPDAPVYQLLFDQFASMNIGACLYIGGNDSMDTVDKLSRCAKLRQEEVAFIGVPKTIDNDLPVTDHVPGYGSAAKYVASAVRAISLDASVYQQPAVTIVECMGRHVGWVTGASALARSFPGDNPLLIYMPETPFDMEQFFADVKNALDRQPNVVICVSEGIKDSHGRFICEYAAKAGLDSFGHKMLTGSAKLLESYVRSQFHVKVRSVELNVNQRCSSLITSAADVEDAVFSGRMALQKVLEGATGSMVTCSRLAGPGYALEYGLTDVGNVCNKEKGFPLEWITKNGTDISPEFLKYVLPLIAGEPEQIMELGLPKYLYRA